MCFLQSIRYLPSEVPKATQTPIPPLSNADYEAVLAADTRSGGEAPETLEPHDKVICQRKTSDKPMSKALSGVQDLETKQSTHTIIPRIIITEKELQTRLTLAETRAVTT